MTQHWGEGCADLEPLQGIFGGYTGQDTESHPWESSSRSERHWKLTIPRTPNCSVWSTYTSKPWRRMWNPGSAKVVFAWWKRRQSFAPVAEDGGRMFGTLHSNIRGDKSPPREPTIPGPGTIGPESPVQERAEGTHRPRRRVPPKGQGRTKASNMAMLWYMWNFRCVCYMC